MKKKNISLLIITVTAFIFFIISTFAFGFKLKDGPKIDLSDLDDAIGPGKDSYGLMVSGLVFISLTIILAGILLWLTVAKTNIQNKNLVLKWMQISVSGLILLSIILVLSGEALLLNKSYNEMKKINPNLKFGDFWDTGFVAGMFIFTLLPLPLLAVPLFIKK